MCSFSQNAIDVINEHEIFMEINHVCISENLNEDKVQKTLKDIKRDVEKCRGRAFILHGPFTEIIPAAIDERFVKLAMDRLNGAHDLCRELNINKMVVHSGYIPPLYNKEWHIEKSAQFWRNFLHDKGDEFKIYIENVLEDEPFMMKKLCDKIGDDRAKICFDIGHANVMKSNMEADRWICVLEDRIGHVHIHNNFGKEDTHGDVFDGNINIENAMKLLSQLSPRNEITYTVESRRTSDGLKRLIDIGETMKC